MDEGARAGGSGYGFRCSTPTRTIADRPAASTASTGDGGIWQAWKGQPVTRLAEMLDYNSTAPLGDEQRSRRLDAVRAAGHARRAVRRAQGRGAPSGQVTPFDAELVEHFRSQAAVAIQNLQRTESLAGADADGRAQARHRGPRAERVARREQRARRDAAAHPADAGGLRGGKLEPAVLLEDLEQVQKSLQVCRRIFGGMLSFARGAATAGAPWAGAARARDRARPS